MRSIKDVDAATGRPCGVQAAHWSFGQRHQHSRRLLTRRGWDAFSRELPTTCTGKLEIKECSPFGQIEAHTTAQEIGHGGTEPWSVCEKAQGTVDKNTMIKWWLTVFVSKEGRYKRMRTVRAALASNAFKILSRDIKVGIGLSPRRRVLL